MKTQKGEHACLERRHADWLQASSDVSFQLQQQFQQRGARFVVMHEKGRYDA